MAGRFLSNSTGVPSLCPGNSFRDGRREIKQQTLKPDVQRFTPAEMMNWPGTVNRDELVMWRKIRISKKYGKPIDGHMLLV
jgi:adenine deaminase